MNAQNKSTSSYLRILGTVQDGGAPHIGCEKKCCSSLSFKEKQDRKVTALEISDLQSEQSLLFEASPDIVSQWAKLRFPLKGIFLTHAHMGHYSGLLHLGREALGAKNIAVYAMPRMGNFLKQNTPWSQLIDLNNIELNPLELSPVEPIKNIRVTPLLVPHRDEFSETVGFRIQGPNKTILFIPDIDKWSLWEKDLITELKKVDLAFVDATFFNQEEVNYRPLSQIPHPLVKETVDLLKAESWELKDKIYFIHMNHTNPLLDPKSKETKWVLKQGFHIARIGQQFDL